MPTKTIVRGDSYAIRRPIYRYEFLDAALTPFDLRGCKIQITYKPEITTIESDAVDASGVIKHEAQFNLAGTQTVTNGIYLVTTAIAGIVDDRWSKTETAALPVGTILYGDLQLTDVNNEVFTWIFSETVTATDGLTHRAVT